MKESINSETAVFCSDCMHKNICKWMEQVKQAEEQLAMVDFDALHYSTNVRPNLTFDCPQKQIQKGCFF